MTATKVLFGVAGLALAASAQAQYSTNFEPPLYTGSAAGSPLTNGFGGGGQDGWYNPVAGSIDGNVYTYAGNAVGIVNNPTGGTQFAGLRNAATPSRAQHAFAFQNTAYTIAFDFACDRFGGVLPAINNIGSFSLQNSATARFFQTLYTWDNLATGNAFDANYIHFNAAGVQQPNALAGPAWDALNLNTWYRQSTTFDFTTNRILSVSIDNLHDVAAPTVVDVSGLGWYLAGGANPTLPLPTDFRLFTGGGANNTYVTGWDNFSIIPAPATLALLGLSGLIAGRRRR